MLEARVFGGRLSSSMGLVGVDIGSRAVKLLQLREQGSECIVVGAGEEYIRGREGESGGLPLAERLRRTFSTSGFTGRRCVVSLPRSIVKVQSIRMPSMPQLELLQAAEWEATQRFEMNRDEMVVQAIRTGGVAQGNENREEVLLIAAAREDIEQQVRPILDAGLRPMAVETDFAAIARFFTRKLRRESDRQHVNTVLDIGASGSTVMILRGDQIAFCKPFDLGGHQFNKAVADHLQIDEQEANELRAARLVEVGIASDGSTGTSDSSTNRAVFDAVRPLINELIQEITMCLRYFTVTFRGEPPKSLILTGGDSREPRLRELLEQGCKMPVMIDDEDGTLGRLHAQIEGTMHRRAEPMVCWSVSAGLSIRNLMKKSIREQRAARAREVAA